MDLGTLGYRPGSNRTFMELKLAERQKDGFYRVCSNRTFMELKLIIQGQAEGV